MVVQLDGFGDVRDEHLRGEELYVLAEQDVAGHVDERRKAPGERLETGQHQAVDDYLARRIGAVLVDERATETIAEQDLVGVHLEERIEDGLSREAYLQERSPQERRRGARVEMWGARPPA